ncbi:MAG: hypothetical protein IJ938_03290, partial [Clostridia bacterium]|nr:hypothetical protein [Clostridia bacterium]
MQKESLGKRLLQLFLTFLKIGAFTFGGAEMTSDGKTLTEREKKALEYFNKGEYDNAKQILEDVERENELERFESYVET